MTGFEFALAAIRILVWPCALIIVVWILRKGVVSFLARQSGGKVEITAPMVKGSLGWQNRHVQPQTDFKNGKPNT
jgi:hypothetical protein